MRLRDENKRRLIIQTAIKLFSEQPFHKVRLDDVAAEAGIGKGTVYIYFKSKEDLYYSLIYDGFADLVQRLTGSSQNQPTDPVQRIKSIVRELVAFAIDYPQLYEAMRTVALPGEESQWEGKRREMTAWIESALRDGIKSGVFDDTHPELTALYFTAMVRAVLLYGPKKIDGEMLSEHISSMLLKGICKTRS